MSDLVSDARGVKAVIDELLTENAKLRLEIERMRPVFEAAIVRHKAYFGPTAHRAAKQRATMGLNKATNRARGGT